MKLHLDMNLSPKLVSSLRDAGHDTRHWRDVGDPAATDTSIFQFARSNDCVVITHDLDFGDILAASKTEKPSVMIVRARNLQPAGLARLVVEALADFETDLQRGALLILDVDRRRLRVLPLA